MMAHNKDESGTSEGLFYDYDEEMVVTRSSWFIIDDDIP